MSEKKSHTTTTFQLSHDLHAQLRMVCAVTNKRMGEFIRLAVLDKIKQIKEEVK